MIKSLSVIFVVLMFFILLVSCSDSPTDIGESLVKQDGLLIRSYNSLSDSVFQSSASKKIVIPLSTSSTLVLGKAENVEASTLLNFTFLLPDSIKTQLRDGSLRVLGSKIKLVQDYRFGEENGSFDFSAYKIENRWTSTTFTSDSLIKLIYQPNDVSSNRTNVSDSILVFDIDTSVVKEWLLNTVDTSTAKNYGIILSPAQTSTKVLGFKAFSISETDPRLDVIIEKPGSYVDTIQGFIIADVSVAVGELPQISPPNNVIQSSLTSVTRLFFDLSKIPNNAIINNVKLTVTLDTLETKVGTSYTNSLRVYYLTDSTNFTYNKDVYQILNRSGNNFTGDLTGLVFSIKDSSNYQGLLLKAGNELKGLETFVIKGSNSPDYAERPKLEIIYSSKQ